MPDHSPHDVLGEVFAAHEHLAPSATEVLAGLDLALVARRRTRRAVVASSGAVVAVGAVTVGVLASTSSGSRSADNTGAATIVQTPIPVRSSVAQGSSAPPLVAPLPGTLTFTPGWLPGVDATMTNYSIAADSQYRGYDVAAIGTKDLYIALTVDEHGSLPTDTKRGAEQDLTVGGRPARESVTGDGGSYQLGVALGGGRELTVIIQNNTSGPAISPADVRATGRHIARDIHYGTSEQVHPPLVLSALPSGLTITSVALNDGYQNGIEDTQATDYVLSAGAAEAVDVSTQKGAVENGYFPPVAPGSGGMVLPDPKHPSTPVAGREVDGHHTQVIRGEGATELVVKDFQPGRDVVLTGNNRLASLDDLYAVAGGMSWRG